MDVRELLVKLGFNVDEKPLERFERGIETVKQSLEAIIGLEAGAVASIFEFTKATSEYGEDIKRNALITGLSYAAYQKYKFAANQAGVENEEFTIGIRYLNRAVGEANLNIGRFPELFKRMGIAQKELHSGNNDILIPKVADYLKAHKDIAAGLGMQLFGRGGALMASWLSRGSADLKKYTDEAAKLGVMTDEDVEASENFEKAQKSLMYTITQTRNEIGVRLFPIVQKVIQKFQEWWIQNKKIIDQNLDIVMRRMADFAGTLWTVFTHVAAAAKDIADAFGGVYNFGMLALALLTAMAGARIIMGLAGLLQIINAIKVAQLGLWVTNPYFLLTALIFGMILALQDFWTALQGGHSIFDGLADAADRFFTALDAKLDAAFRAIGQAIKHAFMGVWDEVWGALVASYKAIVPQWLQKLLQGAAHLVADVAVPAAKGVAKWWESHPSTYNPVNGFELMPANAPHFGQSEGNGPNLYAYMRQVRDQARGLGPMQGPLRVQSEIHVTMQVPEGTPEAHAQAFAAKVKPIVDAQLGKAISHAIANYPRQEQK